MSKLACRQTEADFINSLSGALRLDQTSRDAAPAWATVMNALPNPHSFTNLAAKAANSL